MTSIAQQACMSYRPQRTCSSGTPFFSCTKASDANSELKKPRRRTLACSPLSRQLRRLRSQVCHDVPWQLPRPTPHGAVCDGCIPSACCKSDRDVQPDGAISTLEVSCRRCRQQANDAPAPRRPKEHHVHDILYFVKTAFKERGLEKLNEMDVVNKEAFK